jgi:hypothetical protein
MRDEEGGMEDGKGRMRKTSKKGRELDGRKESDLGRIRQSSDARVFDIQKRQTTNGLTHIYPY